MAPHQSLLPVLRNRRAPSALPRPAPPVPRSPNLAYPAAHDPLTPARSILELSRFDLDGLLDSRADSEAGDLFRDEEPSWLADQSAFTLAARTPARATVEFRLRDESMLPADLLDDNDDEADQVVLATLGPAAPPHVEENPAFPEPLAPSPAPIADTPTANASASLASSTSPPPGLTVANGTEQAPQPVLGAPSPGQHVPVPSHETSSASPPPSLGNPKAESVLPPSPSSRPPAKPQIVPHRPSLVRLPQGPAHPPACDESVSLATPSSSEQILITQLPKVEEEEEENEMGEEEEDVGVSADAQPAFPSLQAPPAALSTAAPPAPVSTAAPVAVPHPFARSLPPQRVPPQPPAAAQLRSSLAPERAAPVPDLASAASKKPAAAKGIKDADEAARRRVREAKADRDRAAKERRERLEREAEAKRMRARETKGKTREVLPPVASGAAPRAAAAASAPAVVSHQSALEDIATSVGHAASTSAELLEVVPVFALDVDSSLPRIGAPLEFARPKRGDLGTALLLDVGGAGVTNTPARPLKRRAADEPVDEEIAPAQQVQAKGKARRTTLALSSALGAQVQEEPTSSLRKAEVQEEVALPAPKPVEPAHKACRRPSRVSLGPPHAYDIAASTSTSGFAPPPVARPTKGKAVRVSLLPPIPDDESAHAVNLGASACSGKPELSRSQRRASRVSFTLAPALTEQPAEDTHAGLSGSLSASTARRRASRVSLAPPPPTPPSAQAFAAGLMAVQTEQAPDPLKTSTRRASRVFAALADDVQDAPELIPASPGVTFALPSADPPTQHNPLARSAPRTVCASTSRHLASSTSRALPLSASRGSAPSAAEAAPVRAPPPGVVLGGVTLPSSFSFAESATAAEREADKVRRAEERERRERAAERVLEEKKRKREVEGSWTVALGKKEDDGVKRARLAASLTKSTASAPTEHPPAGAEVSSSPLGPTTAPDAPVDMSGPSARSPSPTQPLTLVPETLALTREALERNTRRAGPKPSLERRVSLWALERLEEDEADEKTPEEQVLSDGHAAAVGDNLRAAAQAASNVAVLAFAPTEGARPDPAAPPAVAAPPAPARGKGLPPAPPRTTAPAPFRFSRTSRGPPLADSGPAVQPAPAPAPASPMFSARLGAWRERERRGRASSGAPPRVQNQAQPACAPVRREALGGAAPAARPGKRARVAPRAVEPQAAGKENALAPAPVSAHGPAVQGVAVELARLTRERMEWSDRQKKREEGIRRRRERERAEEAECERNKLKLLRASLARGAAPIAKTGGARKAARV
ncbi:hypothetical protein JCM3770_006576 [Rhodotorula araucariae]